MNLLEAFEASRIEIGRQVNAAAESLPADELLSLKTELTRRPNGSLTLRQPGGTVTLTASQVRYLMERIAAGVEAAS
jgi:hypothetical protein